jgi:type IV pilus assembly protein PilY1
MIRTLRSKLLTSLLIAVFFAVPNWPVGARAQGSCETPLFLQQNSGGFNALFIFDTSGSMNDCVYHSAYDPFVNYSGPFTTETTYRVVHPAFYEPSDFIWGAPTSPSAYLVNSDKGQDGGYLGNYLNWVYFYATDTQRAEIPAVTRIQVAKACVNDLVLSSQNIRFGIMDFWLDKGGQIVSPLGTDPATVATEVNEIAAAGWTPLGESLVDADSYLRDDPTAIEYSCQRTFVIIVTDGFPTMDLDVPSWIGDYDNDGHDPGTCQSMNTGMSNANNCSDYLDDVALYLYENDIRADLDGMQNAITYTIGFNIDAGFLMETANNGGGLYFNANNSSELTASLELVFSDIYARISSGSAVAVVSSENAEENTLYRSKFMPTRWKGHLEAFALPYEEGDGPLWDAGSQLVDRDPANRRIFTQVNGQEMEFDELNNAYLAPELDVGIDNDGDGQPDDYDYDLAGEIINYIRGVDIDGYRDRDGWKLGDVISSAPVVAGSPGDFHQYNDYMAFRAAHENRERVVYVGANDGMLHCFRASDGEELWGYIPQACLPRLKDLLNDQYCHEYFVDATPEVIDAFVGGYWRTVLLCGQGEGGDSYFAIDVTDPNAPYLMWDESLPTYGESWSKPQVARVSGYSEPLVFFGSGPDDVNGEAQLVALDLATGVVVWSDLLSSSMEMNMATGPVVIDMEFDGWDDLLYVCDLAGHVWRFDLTSAPFQKELLFATDQPIQASPILTVDELGQVMVYFGTGRYIDQDDINDVSQQTFYCVIDNQSGVSVDRYDLVDQTSSIQQVTSGFRGWYIDLVQAAGERITKQDAMVAGVVYFTSFQPNSEVCGSGGWSWLYAVDFRDGSAMDNDDGTENDVTDGRVTDIGTGIGSEPVFDIANEQIIVQLNDTRISVQDVEMDIRRLIVRSWREQWN